MQVMAHKTLAATFHKFKIRDRKSSKNKEKQSNEDFHYLKKIEQVLN